MPTDTGMSIPPRSPSVLQTPARQRAISSEMDLPVGHPHALKQSFRLNVSQTAWLLVDLFHWPQLQVSIHPPVPLTPLAPSPLSQSMVYSRSTSMSPPQHRGSNHNPLRSHHQKLVLNRALVAPENPLSDTRVENCEHLPNSTRRATRLSYERVCSSLVR